MSSIQRSSAPSQPSSSLSEPTSTKKKFGKNLNKLTKPPAPPISATAGSGRSGGASSRNGLLLLSTKRSSSSGNTSSSAGGGLLSGKPSSSSPRGDGSFAHDALLSAAVGASRSGDDVQAQQQQQPDAWGVAEKPTSPTSDSSPGATLAPKGGVTSGVHNSKSSSSATHEDNLSPTTSASAISPGKASDEDDEQLAYMSRLARERAERRRAEEESRFHEQKERAARRLRELEKKMSTGDDKMEKGDSYGPSSRVIPMASPSRLDASGVADGSSSQTLKSPVVLERLGRTKTGGESSGLAQGDRGNGRTLFDPNRTDPSRSYSSLVGGNSSQKNESRGDVDEMPANVDRPSGPSGLYQHSRDVMDEQPPNPVIHLSSYEDRDRGERNSSAGPRMLFDPKSGTMVAVPSREEGSSGARGGRKERSKQKGRSSRDRDKDRDSTVQSANPSLNDVSLLKPSRKPKGRKDDVALQKRERRRGESGEVAPSSSKDDSKSARARGKTTRLPRTCGVLYTRDGRGNCVCADGCDGDQGYGAHSVPGGRLKNPDAHAEFMELHQQLYQQEEAPMFDVSGTEHFGGTGYLNELQQHHTDGGFVPSVPQAAPPAPKVEWVKPNEKIELVTGVDDSPTLQATANPWAPSEAALAAAAAAQEYSAEKSPRADIDDGVDSDEDDGPSFIGLGFDPTENMDSVMRSPATPAKTSDRFDAVDLAGLSLDPGAESTTRESTTRNVFAFGSPTWGTSGSGGTNPLSNWSALGVGSGDAAFGPGGIPDTKGQDKPVAAATPFLSLASLSVNQERNTWGTAGLTGLGGSALSSTHGSDHGARTTAD